MPITYTPDTHAKCHGCGVPTPLERLDAKPFRGATPEDCRRAADTGADFERLECETCYGPGWLPLN